MPKYLAALLFLVALCAHSADVTISPPTGSGFVVKSNDGLSERFKVNESGEVNIKWLPDALTDKNVCWDAVLGKLSACSRNKRSIVVDSNGKRLGERDPLYFLGGTIAMQVDQTKFYVSFGPYSIGGVFYPGKSKLFPQTDQARYTNTDCTGPVIEGNRTIALLPLQLRQVVNGQYIIYIYNGFEPSSSIPTQSGSDNGGLTCNQSTYSVNGWIPNKVFNLSSLFAEPFSVIEE